MSGTFNIDSVRQFTNQNSNLGRIAEKINPADLNPSKSPLDASNLEKGNLNRLPQSGTWDGEKGNSVWHPNKDDMLNKITKNDDVKKWDDVLEDYGIDGIPFNDGEPDFSEISKGTVEIDEFSLSRHGAGGNFDQADHKLAELKGCTTEEVRQWRSENKYTWHEMQDCKTMMKVPSQLHGNVPHAGGIAKLKSQNTDI